MNIVLHIFLVYITLFSFIEKNDIVSSKIPKEFLRFPEKTRGVWTDFKKCLMDKDDSLSRGIWSNFKECLKDEDDAESRGLWSALKALLLDKNEDEAEELFKQMDSKIICSILEHIRPLGRGHGTMEPFGSRRR